MLFHIVLFFVALQSVICDFPPYINKCPLPDPNANDCLLNNARNAYPYLFDGEPTLNLPSYEVIDVNGESLILEYSSPNSNTEILLTGQIIPSSDAFLYEASINLNWKTWNLVSGGSSAASYFYFILNIYDSSGPISAKGTISITQDNWRATYNGNYETEQINGENFMQITWGYAFVTDDTFDITYSPITTLDDQLITGPTLIRVKKALRNFENAYRNKQNEISEVALTSALNAILKLEPEEDIFLPAPDPCAQNK